MINSQDIIDYGIDIFLNTENIQNVPLLDIIKIDNTLYGRLDIVCAKYYNKNLNYLKFLMNFNNISDPTEVKLGMVLEIPDIDLILAQLQKNFILSDDIIPGISKTMDSNVVNSETNNSLNGKSTTALPKLQIQVDKVTYNSTTGQIKF